MIGLRKRLNLWLSRRPSSNPFVSGDTFRRISDHIWEVGNRELTQKELKPGEIIFCESEMIVDLCERVLNHSSTPVTILLGNSDINHTQVLSHTLENSCVVSVFAQNLVEAVPGVQLLPIGLENAWHSKNGRVKDFRAIIRKSNVRIFRIMWAFNLETNKPERSTAAKELVNNPAADRLDPLTPRQHRSALYRYSFVASPPGNGLDCHRTWEAMYLGCVPIVLRSHTTEVYENIGLPIWVIDSYEELRSMTERKLKEKYLEFSPKFGCEAMWVDYWISQIKSHVL